MNFTDQEFNQLSISSYVSLLIKTMIETNSSRMYIPPEHCKGKSGKRISKVKIAEMKTECILRGMYIKADSNSGGFYVEADLPSLVKTIN